MFFFPEKQHFFVVTRRDFQFPFPPPLFLLGGTKGFFSQVFEVALVSETQARLGDFHSVSIIDSKNVSRWHWHCRSRTVLWDILERFGKMVGLLKVCWLLKMYGNHGEFGFCWFFNMFEYMFAFFAWFACSWISLNDLHMFASFCIYLDMMFRIWFEVWICFACSACFLRVRWMRVSHMSSAFVLACLAWVLLQLMKNSHNDPRLRWWRTTLSVCCSHWQSHFGQHAII